MNLSTNFFANNTSAKSSVETAGSIAHSNNAETAGSVACLLGTPGGADSFGDKGLFGTPDFSNMDTNFSANASSVETAGSIACGPSVETAGSIACGSSDGGFSGGGDCGGGSFTSMG